MPAEATRPVRRPRIAYVLKKFPRLSETFVLQEIVELERQGAEVHVLSLYLPDEGRFHADVARLSQPVRFATEMKARDLFRRFAADGQALGRLGDRFPRALAGVVDLGEEAGLPVFKRILPAYFALRELGVEHLHAHFATIATRTARALSRLLDVPYSFTAHAKDIYRRTVDPERFADLVDDAAFAVTVCEANRRYILERLAPGRDAKVVRLYNGVDLERFRPRPRKADVDPPLVLSVGRLVPKKGMDVLLRAMRRLLDRGARARLAIVGDGEERERLENLIVGLRLEREVELLGALPQERVLPLYGRAAVCALACVTDAEGNRDALPTTLLEAAACGLPCVSTPVVGVPEIVEHGVTGLLVPEGDAEALALALERLLGDREEAARMGAAARRRAEERFGLRRNVGRLLDLFGRTPARAEAAP